jgi:two-component system alkaline phosphatase synthesis response regulator PhoP
MAVIGIKMLLACADNGVIPMTKKAKGLILAIDDEPDILEMLKFNVEREGYTFVPAESGESAIEKLESVQPSLILLDLMLPGQDGLEIAKTIRGNNKTAHIPIIMLTAKKEESDEVIGLELGADDYVAKPFSPRVLLARIKNVLRRRREQAEKLDGGSVIRIEELEIDPVRFEVRIQGKTVKLTYTEFSLLYFLAGKPGWVYSRYQIVDALKGEDYVVTERSVDVQVVGLRKKLGKFGTYIETVRGVGYRFKEGSTN